MQVLFPEVLQSGHPLQCWFGRGVGTVIYSINLRKVNEVTVKDRYLLPKISECIDALVGCEYFSCMDMAITRSR